MQSFGRVYSSSALEVHAALPVSTRAVRGPHRSPGQPADAAFFMGYSLHLFLTSGSFILLLLFLFFFFPPVEASEFSQKLDYGLGACF